MSTIEALALGWEPRTWEPRSAQTAMSRLAAARRGTTYQAAVPARIATMRVTLDDAVTAAAEDARAEVTRFDAELSAMFERHGDFAPLASVLLRTESASSSQIENITASSRALALAEIGLATYGSNADLVVANVDAMQRAVSGVQRMTPPSILAIHAALMHHQPAAKPGAFRSEPVWIGGSNDFPHGADFVPPHSERIADAVVDLCAFADRTDQPLIAQVALAHAQFETIHPFIDGNGRTGRALVHAMLKHGGSTTRTTVPVSAGLLTDTGAYFSALTTYRSGDPNPIVARFSEATFAAISNSRVLASALKEIEGRWRAHLTARRDSAAWEVLPILLAQPAVTSRLVQEQTGVSQPAADRALRQLSDAGIVTVKNEHGKERRRDVVWRSDEVIAALDEFGERARRGRS
ncbi:MAG: Fic family protein [Phycicoccus sp.]